ncbi:ROK family protein [soil metagenome]
MPTTASPTPVASVALAIDLGGTKVESALIDGSGALVAGSRFRAPTGRESSSEQLAASVRRVVEQALAAIPDGAILEGVGIGSAGPIEIGQGLVSPLNLPTWRGYPLRDLVVGLVPAVPVVLRMDGQCIALAEHWIGAAKGVDNFMGMIVSTGIGGGLILGGKVVPGPTGNAGHIGHVEVGGFDDICDCGGVGCVEGVASGPKTVRWARTQGFAGTTGEDLAAAYAVGDPIARAAVERSGRAIGQAIASATALVDLDLIAIGGGFSRVTPDIFDHINTAIQGREKFGYVTKAVAIPSALSDEGPLIGSGALIHRSEFVN